jgi:hypothetical protein
MKIFLLKTFSVCFALIVLYKFTVGGAIAHIEAKYKTYASKQQLMAVHDKLRKEVAGAINKDRILSEQDAALVHQFVYKIISEIKEVKEVKEAKA